MKTYRHVLLVLLFATVPVPLASAAEPEGLIAHWKLAGDAREATSGELKSVVRDVDFQSKVASVLPGQAAVFNGRSSQIEVADVPALRLGSGDFTLALWVHTSEKADDLAGDLLSKYDPVKRRGFNLSITDRPGVTHSQANQRQLHFGLDDGKVEAAEWFDHGRPGKAVFIQSLAVHDGNLFAGTCEPGKDEAGHVYRLGEGKSEWIDCGAPDRSNAIAALAAFGGKLYAGTGKYRLGGSSLAESENPHLGGKVYRYEGEQRWTFCGQLPETESVGGMVVFRGELFASSLYKPAGFFRYAGDEHWEALQSPLGKRAESLMVFNGQLFASCYDEGHVFRFDGKAWNDCGQVGPAENTQTYAFAAYRGELYVATWRTGRVFKYRADHDWEDCGRLGEELEVMGMAVHNGKLYAGTLPSAEVYRYDDGTTWTKVGTLDKTPDVKYRRAWTMAEFGGRLYCGTLPSGKVWSFAAGHSVTFDRELPPGWRHIAAVRSRDKLSLYVDGQPVASRTWPQLPQMNIDCDSPLQIGFGPHDHLHGALRDVRIYQRALQQDEIARLAKP